MSIIEIVLYLLFALVIGVILGMSASKIISKINEKRLQKNARKCIEGRLKNEFSYGGETRQVNKFVIRQKDGTQKPFKFEEVVKK